MPAQTPPTRLFDSAENSRLAYRLRPGAAPTFVFLPGYASDMEGAKALALDSFAEARGLGLLRFDYSGTGASEGRFADGTLERWLDEALALIDALTAGPLLLVGSSMGGWLALHVALRRPERVRALVGIAAAPDFSEWGFSAGDKEEIERAGTLVRDGQTTTRAFWHSAQALRLLDAPIALHCPVRLVHGAADDVVPVEIARRLVAALCSADVQLAVLKDGGHRLSQPREIAAILASVADLLELCR